MRKSLALLLTVIGLTLGSFAMFWRFGLRDGLRADATTSRMVSLSTVVRSERLREASEPTLLAALAKYNLPPKYLDDAWGNRFIIEITPRETGELSYRITSVGRDGERGSCCQRFLASKNPDQDIVMEDGEWLQTW